uniref:Uncharacterized protein n=1 Tax=Romanomermis culicivorax TaxID=13658 RepID=A0A915JBP6_ROMCU
MNSSTTFSPIFQASTKGDDVESIESLEALTTHDEGIHFMLCTRDARYQSVENTRVLVHMIRENSNYFDFLLIINPVSSLW